MLRRWITLVISCGLAVAVALPVMGATHKATLKPSSSACNSSFDPYNVSRLFLQACGIRIFPRQAVKTLSDGGKV